MYTVLVPTDGSVHAERALQYCIELAALLRPALRVELLTVQLPLAGVNVKLFIKPQSIEEHYREEGQRLLDGPLGQLKSAAICCEPHIGVGDPASVIVEFSKSLVVDQIVMGTQGRGALAEAVMGSVARRVVQESSVPILLIPALRGG